MTLPPEKKTNNNARIVGVSLLVFALFLWISFIRIPFGGLNEIGQMVVSQTETQTETQTRFSSITTTETDVAISTETQTTFVTVTQQLPPFVSVSGDAKTKGVGTTATQVLFVQATNGSIYASELMGAHYSVLIPNNDTYRVYIEFSQTVGSGRCEVKLWSIASLETSITANLEC